MSISRAKGLSDLFEMQHAVKNASCFESQDLNTLKLLKCELYFIVVSLLKGVARCSSKISNLVDVLWPVAYKIILQLKKVFS